tara:strand:- start:76 stop:291 length:216 start_codon:yes stop_codon:yes gene_type:complete
MISIVVLFVGFIGSLITGITLLNNSESAIHEILSAIFLLISAVLIVGLFTVDAINRLKRPNEIKNQNNLNK